MPGLFCVCGIRNAQPPTTGQPTPAVTAVAGGVQEAGGAWVAYDRALRQRIVDDTGMGGSEL